MPLPPQKKPIATSDRPSITLCGGGPWERDLTACTDALTEALILVAQGNSDLSPMEAGSIYVLLIDVVTLRTA